MSFHSKSLVRHGQETQNGRHLLSLNYERYGRGMIAFHPDESLLIFLHLEASSRISPIASLETVQRIYRSNPDTIIAFSRAKRQKAMLGDDRRVGFLAHLPLNKAGHLALLDGRLNTLDPQTFYLAPQNERPAAVYYWAVSATPDNAGGVALAVERMTSAKYAGLPIFCKAATKEGWSIFRSMGFIDGAVYPDGRKSAEPLMQCLPPDPAEYRQSFDSYVPGANRGTKRASVTVVHELDDLLKVLAVRAATYLEDQNIPYDEDVDGNDFTATHLLGRVGEEAAGCLRIRYFAGFVKFERLAVLPRFRGALALQLIRAGIAFARMKGYRRFYGQAAEDVTKLWERFGFRRREGEGIQYLTDQTYYEMDLELDAPNVLLTPTSGAAVLVRPEGQWDRPGILEAGTAT